MTYVVVNERALENAYAVGPFDSAKAAEDWADANHTFPQIWRVVELRPPQS